MPDSNWTGVVGAVTGVIGALTGITGMIMGFIGYRRSNQIKSLDLRLELRKSLGEAHGSLATLRTLMGNATGSRRAVMAARGIAQSGAMVAWEQVIAADRQEANRLMASIRDENADFAALSSEQLESEIVAAHKINSSLSALVGKYRDELATDEANRRQIADQATAMAAARMGRKP
ncbi:hypothetical protein B0G77_2466 [Paraburkholderia sp. BL10I2N1]|nr:hypothetical protein B0G77_2466 [Paraburkholderia sp. BL10I2N1]